MNFFEPMFDPFDPKQKTSLFTKIILIAGIIFALYVMFEIVIQILN